MFVTQVRRFAFTRFNTVLEAAAKYKNSNIQSKMHEFNQNDEKIAKAKKHIDY